MWWLGHLILISMVFGLGFSSREALEAWRSLNKFLLHGSEQPSHPRITPQATLPQTSVTASTHHDPFVEMQAKADAGKLAELRAAIKPSH